MLLFANLRQHTLSFELQIMHCKYPYQQIYFISINPQISDTPNITLSQGSISEFGFETQFWAEICSAEINRSGDIQFARRSLSINENYGTSSDQHKPSALNDELIIPYASKAYHKTLYNLHSAKQAV